MTYRWIVALTIPIPDTVSDGGGSLLSPLVLFVAQGR
jgi:hypothetical protein